MPASVWTLDPNLLGVNLVWLESVGIPAPASHITSLDYGRHGSLPLCMVR